MKEQVGKVTGLTGCPANSFLLPTDPHEPYTSYQGDDERVSCVSCNRFTSEIPRELINDVQALPASVRQVLLALTSQKFKPEDKLVPVYRIRRIGSKGLFSDPMTDDDHQRASAAVAQGHAGTLLEEARRMTIQLSLSTKLFFDTVTVSFLPAEPADGDDARSELARANALDTDGHCRTKYRPASVTMEELLGHPQISPARARALLALEEQGFVLTSAIDVESSMRRILLRNTTVDGATGEVTVEFNWID